jgi:hypothetical protein
LETSHAIRESQIVEGQPALLLEANMMRRLAALLAIVLGSMMLYAQETPKGIDMTGTICDSKCVAQSAGQSACDLKCTQTGGDAVFIEDNGKVTKIANPEKVKGFKGKRVKAKCEMMKDQDMMNIYEIYSLGPG